MSRSNDIESSSGPSGIVTPAGSDGRDDNSTRPDIKDLQCQVKEYEARWDIEGKRSVKEVEHDLDADLKDGGKFALRSYKYYSRSSKIEKVNLEIHSPHIRDALRTVIRSYPGQNFTGSIVLTGNSEHSTLDCLFHYRRELREYGDSLDNPTARKHVHLAVDFLEKELGREIHRFEANIQAETPCIDFRDIWMLFKPSTLLFAGKGHSQCINNVVRVAFNSGGSSCLSSWNITAEALAHNGSNFGYTHRPLYIFDFDGVKDITNLEFYPLVFHPAQDTLKGYLIRRGQNYCDLAGTQYKAYSGKAIAVEKTKTVNMTGRASYSYLQESIALQGRVMLDAKSFIDERTDAGIKLEEVLTSERSQFTETEYMLCHFSIAGFSLSEKQWCWFFVDFIQDVVFDDGAFDALLLPAKQKRLIRALTARHTSGGKDSFDDLIQGKGQGCIFLLHGEPGIGKTFTAESLADDIKRPLYVLMSGELGSDVETVDKRLRKVLKLVTDWKAILLIDEADVFLEKRSSHDLARNSLVSIFLRTLEYFSGVMFLTTNRINTFDPAFQSRIHLALKYHELNADSRESLWKLFLKRTPDFKEEDWPPETFRDLAATELNGRQIKNTVRTAYALALAENQKFSVQQVQDVLDTVTEFQTDFLRGQTQANAELDVGGLAMNMQGLGLGRC
ncbi:P-loop containing nucleoside triphosphate hydrolase protein [Xylariomycetidae sp. FL0641]|nr:P-loop containing nucleoside triphosphate hydrolase protein [Xylariomycetidae sp. FL0641]